MSKEFGPPKLSQEIEKASDALFNKPIQVDTTFEAMGITAEQMLDAIMGPLPGRPPGLSYVLCSVCGCRFSMYEVPESPICHFCSREFARLMSEKNEVMEEAVTHWNKDEVYE